MFYLDIIAIPLIVGIVFRLLFIRKEKGFYATLAALAVAIAFIANAVIFYATGHSGDAGSEGPGLLAWAAVTAFLGTAVTGVLRQIYVKYR